MLEGGSGASLEQEPVPSAVIGGQPGGEKLQCYAAFEPDVPGEVDGAHPAPAELV